MVNRDGLMWPNRTEIYQNAIYHGQVFDNKHFWSSGKRRDFKLCMSSTYYRVISGEEMGSSHDEFITVMSRFDRQRLRTGDWAQGNETGRQYMLHLRPKTPKSLGEMLCVVVERDWRGLESRGMRGDRGRLVCLGLAGFDGVCVCVCVCVCICD